MTRNRRIAWEGLALALALGVVSLVGCQHITRLARPPAPPPDLAEAGAKVTPAQVADVKISLGRTAERKGDLDGAIAAYREALEHDRHRADAYWRLAVVHDRRAQFRESARLYEKALDLDPKNPEIHCDQGYGLYLQSRWAEAERSLRRAIDLRADHRRAHINLGLVLARDARPKEALEEFRRGGCSAADAHNNLAFALTLDSQWDEARAQYRLALAAAPASKETRTRLQELDHLVAAVNRRPAPRDPAVTRAAAPPAAAPPAAAPPAAAPPAAAPRDAAVTPAAAPPAAAAPPRATSHEPRATRPEMDYAGMLGLPLVPPRSAPAVSPPRVVK